jgi:hypothetical protein
MVRFCERAACQLILAAVAASSDGHMGSTTSSRSAGKDT